MTEGETAIALFSGMGHSFVVITEESQIGINSFLASITLGVFSDKEVQTIDRPFWYAVTNWYHHAGRVAYNRRTGIATQYLRQIIKQIFSFKDDQTARRTLLWYRPPRSLHTSITAARWNVTDLAYIRHQYNQHFKMSLYPSIKEKPTGHAAKAEDVDDSDDVFGDSGAGINDSTEPVAPTFLNLMHFSVQLACVMNLDPVFIADLLQQLENLDSDSKKLWYTDEAMRILALFNNLCAIETIFQISEKRPEPRRRYGASLAQIVHHEAYYKLIENMLNSSEHVVIDYPRMMQPAETTSDSSNSDLDIEFRFAYTPLGRAALFGRMDIVGLLLRHGADVNMAHENGNNPIIAALHAGDDEILDLLLSRGADPNHPETRSVLCTAIDAYASADAIKMLLTHGATVNHPRQSPLANIAYNTHHPQRVEIMTALLTQVDFKHRPVPNDRRSFEMFRNHNDALIWVTNKGDVDGLRLLLEHGANPDHLYNSNYSDDGRTALTKAVIGSVNASKTKDQSARTEMVQLLLKHGADPNLPTPSTEPSALGYASQKGCLPIVRSLLEAGADVNKTGYRARPSLQPKPFWRITTQLFDKSIRTSPLWLAVENNRTDVIKLLLKQSAYHSILPSAAGQGKVQIVQTLLNCGDDPNGLDHTTGETALEKTAILTAKFASLMTRQILATATLPKPVLKLTCRPPPPENTAAHHIHAERLMQKHFDQPTNEIITLLGLRSEGA